MDKHTWSHAHPGCGYANSADGWSALLYVGATSDRGAVHQCPRCGSAVLSWYLVPTELVAFVGALHGATKLPSIAAAWLDHRRACPTDALRRWAWRAMGRRGVLVAGGTVRTALAALREQVEASDDPSGDGAYARGFLEPWDALAWAEYLQGCSGAPHRANAYLTRHETFLRGGIARDRSIAVIRVMGTRDELVVPQAVACLETMAEKFKQPLSALPWHAAKTL